MGHASATEIRNPGPYQIPGGLKVLFMVFAAVGVATFAGGMMTDQKRMWIGFLHNHWFFMSLALGGAFFAAIQFATGAMWSAPIRRIAEAFTSYLPVAFVAMIVIFFGLKQIYIWTDPAVVKGNMILEHKQGYLSPVFFAVRNVIGLALMMFFVRKIVGNSVAQDQNGDAVYTDRNKTLSPAFLIVFALGFTMAAFDFLMSLDPMWFSTMFGVYLFAGLFYSVLAAIAIVAILLKRAGPLEGLVNENHLHDLGKFMFAFTVFWAYIGFSQFMLIWYANLPEETGYFLNRMNSGWLPVSVFLIVGKFIIPFFALLPRGSKRSEKVLLAVGAWMLFAQWVDVLWIIQPEFSKQAPKPSWMDFGFLIGFLGFFGLCVARFFARNNVVAIKDPKLVQSVTHHHQ